MWTGFTHRPAGQWPKARKLDKIAFERRSGTGALGLKVLQTRSVETGYALQGQAACIKQFLERTSDEAERWVCAEEEIMESQCSNPVSRFRVTKQSDTLVSVADRPGIGRTRIFTAQRRWRERRYDR